MVGAEDAFEHRLRMREGRLRLVPALELVEHRAEVAELDRGLDVLVAELAAIGPVTPRASGRSSSIRSCQKRTAP